MNTLTAGSDATIRVGGASGYDITSASNTFSNVVPGLSFTVSKLETDVTVSSSLDGSAIATDVKALVDAANSVLSEIAAKTADRQALARLLCQVISNTHDLPSQGNDDE